MKNILILGLLLISNYSTAAVQCPSGVEFADDVVIEGDNNQLVSLDLNGVGLKKVLFFNIFYAAFYLEQTSQDPGIIIPSNQHKVGIIHALRDITQDQLIEQWQQEFERLCGDRCDALRPYHEQFLSYSRDVDKNERLYLISFSDRFELEINQNEVYPPIYSPEYSRLLQRSLFGPDAADPELKKGILGQKKVCKNI